MKISFTSAKIEKITGEHYNITLFNGVAQVYAGTLTQIAAAAFAEKHHAKIAD
jgi:hypothetical protein